MHIHSSAQIYWSLLREDVKVSQTELQQEEVFENHFKKHNCLIVFKRIMQENTFKDMTNICLILNLYI